MVNQAKLEGLTRARPANNTVQRGKRVVRRSVVFTYKSQTPDVFLAGTTDTVVAASLDILRGKGDILCDLNATLDLRLTAPYFPTVEKHDAERHPARKASSVTWIFITSIF